MKNIYTILLLILLPVFSFSQKVEPKADSTKVREVELGEIIISGSKNEMTLKSLPTSVTLLSKTTIQDDNITCLPDITSVAPGVFMPSYGSKLTSPIYIRGIGSRINSPGVGLYVDNVPFFEKSAFNFDFFDIERIEILKGPQGTLYGRNTIGGVINVKTLSPFDFQGVKAKVGVGSYGQYEANAGYYSKFNEQLAVSLTAMYNHRDGFYTNETTNKQVDESDVYSVRNKVIWKPIEKISIENIASMEYSEEGGYPYAVYDSVAGEANPVSYNDYSSYLRKMFSDALVMRYTTENIELKATTAYQYLDDEQQIDQDFTPDSGYFVTQNQKQHMLSQEIIVRSKGNSVYNWLVGGFAFQQTFDKTVDVLVYTPGMTVLKTYDHTIEGAALFHQSELTFNNLKLIGGIRVETESDEQDYLYDRVMGGNVTTVDDTIAKNEFFEILPKVALNYKLNGTNLYASVSRGYKTGGFNSSFDENHPEHMTFEPEHSMNYEIGMKTSLVNKQLYADVALYYIDWENQQIYESNPSGRGSHLTNAGNSVSTGFEASLKTIPFCGYVTSLSYSYNHATFVNYVVNDSVNYNGNFLPYAPQHTVSVRLSKTFQLHNSNIIDKMRISLLYTGVGKIYWNEENTTSQDYYNLVSSNITFMKDGFGLSFWRKNMLDEKYHTFAFNAMGNQYVQLGQPSRYGVRLTYNF